MAIRYQALLEQRKSLDAQIELARKAELAEVLVQVRGLVQDYRLAESDLFHPDGQALNLRHRTTVAPKYRDPLSGATWSGRGKEPRWIAGRERGPFAI